jgi:hypothetical protein
MRRIEFALVLEISARLTENVLEQIFPPETASNVRDVRTLEIAIVASADCCGLVCCMNNQLPSPLLLANVPSPSGRRRRRQLAN